MPEASEVLKLLKFIPKNLNHPNAWVGHMPLAYWIIDKLKPSVFVELGTHTGNSYFSFCQSIQENKTNTKAFAVDTWEGDAHAGFYDESVFERVKQTNLEYSSFSTLMRNTFDTAVKNFDDGSVDLLHIDGLHTYEAVKHDFETWLPKMSSKGVVLFHDTNVRRGDFGVYLLWSELSGKYNSLEFFHSHGLGILDLSQGLNRLIPAQEWQRGELRDLFEGLNEQMLMRFERESLLTERDSLLTERDSQRTERDSLLTERDSLLTELQIRRADAQEIRSSILWRATNFLRHGCAGLQAYRKAVERVTSFMHSKKRVFRPKNSRPRMQKRVWQGAKRALELLKRVGGPLGGALVFFRLIFDHGLKVALQQLVLALKKLSSDSPIENEFSAWYREYAKAEFKHLPGQVTGMRKFSVVIPVYRPGLEYLKLAIDSIIAQSYGNWEVCLADDGSSDTSLNLYLENLQKDSRFSLVQLPSNGGISSATNAASELATGDFLVFLDQDDELTPNALFELQVALEMNPDVKYIYSDEMKVSQSGEPVDHHFKSDLNLELAWSYNYFCHLTAIRVSLFKSLGRMRPEMDGAQDYDLALRVIDRIPSSEIYHIDKILYRWRVHDGSTAKDSHNKPYAVEAGLRVLQDRVERESFRGTVSHHKISQWYQYTPSIPSEQPKVSVIIPTRDRVEYLRLAVASVLDKNTYQNLELLVVDNGSVESETIQFLENLKHDPRVQVISDNSPFNYSALNNKAASISKGDLLLFLNNDIESIGDDWLEELVRVVSEDGVGIAGSKLLYHNYKVQHAGVILGIGGVAGHSHKFYNRDEPGYMGRLQVAQQLSAVTGACLIIHREVFFAVGGFTEELTVAFNDVDLCLRVGAIGYRIVYNPRSELFHHESISRGVDSTPKDISRATSEVRYMRSKWAGVINRDPFYNSNLSRHKEDWSLQKFESRLSMLSKSSNRASTLPSGNDFKAKRKSPKNSRGQQK